MIPHITSELECKTPSGDEKVVVGSLSVQVSASSRGVAGSFEARCTSLTKSSV